MAAVSKVHVTATAGVIAVTSLVCATIALTQGHDASPYFIPVATAIGVIGGVAVPANVPSAPPAAPKPPIGPPTP